MLGSRAVGVIAALALSTAAVAGDVVHLEQNWSPELREQFYFAPQGSHLMPYEWFLALERSGDQTLFSSPQNLARFGWLYHDKASPQLNPGRLPIGMTKEPATAPGGGTWLGMTCAACHTSDVSHEGKVVRIDGAPAMLDFGSFLGALSSAVLASNPAVDAEKFKRFAARVHTARPDGPTPEQLAALYQEFAAKFVGRAWMRTPPLPAGPGRVDALTQIVNSLAVFYLGTPENLHPPVAPTSFPFLWLTPQLDFVQWNPIASSPIARNAGEALGVFGEANFGRDPASAPLSSTVLFDKLFEMEQWVDGLSPPKWPEHVFGRIDQTRWRRGAALFQADCRGCHNMPPFDMTRKEDNIAGKQFIKITRVPFQSVGTDPQYVQSLVGRFVQTGGLGSTLFGGRAVVPGAEFFATTTAAVLRKGLVDAKLSGEQQLAYNGFRFYPKANPSDPNEQLRPWRPPSLTGIKAGPLLGIWATGPFFHNGSVPNLYEVLSPPEQRSQTFWIGSSELDTQKLGFVSKERAGLFKFDTQLPGNRNVGHAYPKQSYTHEQRLDVIEFLKDPQRFATTTP
ncbi:MAG TPA: di-heme-cytochrome C peroxidase [Steroidobacteraceae bacterium]|nr:di-heme-cytochrome C peroxidase [Steroidobacteraceae bacterium]